MRIDARHLLALTSILFILGAGLTDFRLTPAITKDTSPCPFENMARISTYWGSYCIDKYEASEGLGRAESRSGVKPWVYTEWNDAKSACESVGKRLCKDFEWMAACNLDGNKYYLDEEGSGERYSCNTIAKCGDSEACNTRYNTECKSDAGVYDMIGNVHEWTDAFVPDSWPLYPNREGEKLRGSWRYPVREVLGENKYAVDKYGDDYMVTPQDADRQYDQAFVRGGGFVSSRSGMSDFGKEVSAGFGCFFMVSYVTPNNGPEQNKPYIGFRCCYSETNPPEINYTSIEDALVDKNQIFIEHVNLGNEKISNGNYDEAITEYDAALVISPNNTNARVNKAVAVGHRGDMTDALEVFTQVLEVNNTHREALFNKGLALIAQERWQEAYDTITVLVNNQPGDADAGEYLQHAKDHIYVCGDGTCESELGETSDNCCQDCTCSTGFFCSSKTGICEENPPVCGDGKCTGGENLTSCPEDCSVCGDGKCTSSEDLASCPKDCSICGDGNCTGNEDLTSCPEDCSVCGDDKCTGGENLTSCPEDCSVCGDGKCTGNEDPATCLIDCSVCGDGNCTGNEDLTSCPEDCTVCGDYICLEGFENRFSCCTDCECPPGYECRLDRCIGVTRTGDPCAINDQCVSGNCNAGHCCLEGDTWVIGGCQNIETVYLAKVLFVILAIVLTFTTITTIRRRRDDRKRTEDMKTEVLGMIAREVGNDTSARD